LSGGILKHPAVQLQTAPAPAPRRIPGARRRRVLTETARIFSTVCNPFLAALALFVILAHARSHTVTEFWTLAFTSVFFTSIGPMVFVFWLYWAERIADLDMSIRAERRRVFGAFVVFSVVGTLILTVIHAPTIMIASMAAYSANAFVVQMITRYWKISTHALGITAPLITLIVLYGWQPAPFCVLIPIVCWARVYLGSHTGAQVIAGVCLAAVSTLGFFRLFGLI
jgi:membrane-associated phospholipid phosphatase